MKESFSYYYFPTCSQGILCVCHTMTKIEVIFGFLEPKNSNENMIRIEIEHQIRQHLLTVY